MREKFYQPLDKNDPSQKGDLFYDLREEVWVVSCTGHIPSDLPCPPRIRPVDPPTANPWINDRRPTIKDADIAGNVDYWNGRYAARVHFCNIRKGQPWRKVDQTLPPAESTAEEEIEKLLKQLENSDCTVWVCKQIAKIRAKQESEATNDT